MFVYIFQKHKQIVAKIHRQDDKFFSKFSVTRHWRLFGSVISKHSDVTLPICLLSCVRHKQCKSINFKNLFCGRNWETHSHEDFQVNYEWTHLETEQEDVEKVSNYYYEMLMDFSRLARRAGNEVGGIRVLCVHAHDLVEVTK